MSMMVSSFPSAQQAVLQSIGCKPAQKVFLLNGYPAVHTSQGVRYVHRLVAAQLLRLQLNPRIFVHHVDEDRTNFLPANLHACTLAEHNTHHKRSGAANHFFGRKHSADSRSKISQAAKLRSRSKASDQTRMVLSMVACSRRRCADGSGRFDIEACP